MCRECREPFPRRRLQRKPLDRESGMHHGTCVTQAQWCMSRSLTCGGGENVPGIPGACATHNFTYMARGPWWIFAQNILTMGVIDWCYPEFKVFTTRYVSYINSCTTVYIIFLITVSVAVRYVPFTCTHLLMLACHFNVYWRYNTSKQLCAQFAALCCCLIHFVAFFAYILPGYFWPCDSHVIAKIQGRKANLTHIKLYDYMSLVNSPKSVVIMRSVRME